MISAEAASRRLTISKKMPANQNTISWWKLTVIIVWPGQALAYKLEELKFRELRACAEETLGEAFNIRAFHDEVPGRGAVPLGVLDANTRAWLQEQL